MKKLFVVVAAMLVCGYSTSAVHADAFIQGFEGGSSFNIFYGGSTGDVVGYRFTADETGVITHLGILNDQLDGVLDSAHEVGLWDSNGDLIVSTSVDSSGDFIDGFYYSSIAPTGIMAGESYTLGAVYPADDLDSYVSSPTTLDLMHISNTNGVFPTEGDLGFVFPAEDSTNLARIGPNALFEAGGIIPEPGTFGLLTLACVGLMSRRRR